MKKLAILVIATGLLSLGNRTYAQIRRLKPSVTTKKTVQIIKRGTDDRILQEILENNRKATALIEQRSRVPVIWEGNSRILTGKVYRGILLNHINSTNINSPVLVEARSDQGLPSKTRFACEAVTQNKRVFTLCNRMILPGREVPVVAQILNLDGSSGLKGVYDDGKEELILGALASEFSSGVLSMAQTRIAGPHGNITDSTNKNQMYQGLIEAGRTSSELLLNEMKTKEPIINVPSGQEVLIYFMEAVNEN